MRIKGHIHSSHFTHFVVVFGVSSKSGTLGLGKIEVGLGEGLAVVTILFSLANSLRNVKTDVLLNFFDFKMKSATELTLNLLSSSAINNAVQAMTKFLPVLVNWDKSFNLPSVLENRILRDSSISMVMLCSKD